jgi:homoserine O-acetyltransferase
MNIVEKGSLVILVFLACSLSLANAQANPQQQFADFEECVLSSGDVIKPCKLGYRTFGTLNADKSNVMLVSTWFTGTSEDHVYLASPDYLDPETYFVVIVDALANGVSSSPSNSTSQSNDQFPQITIADMVQSQHRLLADVFAIDAVYGVVGLSMGGMQAFEWAIAYPGFGKKTIAAIATPRLPTYDIAAWTTKNTLLGLYRRCQCKEALQALAGVSMLSNQPGKLSQDVSRNKAVSTIRFRGESNKMTLGESWDVQRQTEAMISHNIARDFDDDMRKVASKMQTEFLIVVGDDDRIVTPQPAREFAALVDATLVELDEDCGHGDPWCAPDAFSEAIRSFIATED